ncbi:DUF5462 family protein [Vibrio scophthalmi]|uniref:Uncharacterized protein n=1 Tax=Vibrio scophthalmi TaxID=45658 RepID=A0A1E3WIF1_9VIBR|nr:DUF5462 family protein [Vibrio scophthalmi]ODS05581.1 hypothetical protein VSF3289_04722 [Vibrio scophthalmi]
MKKHWRVVLLCAGASLFFPCTQAAPVVMSGAPMSLGIVNGDVVNGLLTIKRTLSNPVLLSVKQDELDSPLRALVINNAKLIKSQKGEVTVKFTSPVKGGTMETLVTFEVWLDGKKVEVMGETLGSDVQTIVDTPFRLIEVMVTKPLQIQLPQNYRGPFNFIFDIEVKA